MSFPPRVSSLAYPGAPVINDDENSPPKQLSVPATPKQLPEPTSPKPAQFATQYATRSAIFDLYSEGSSASGGVSMPATPTRAPANLTSPKETPVKIRDADETSEAEYEGAYSDVIGQGNGNTLIGANAEGTTQANDDPFWSSPKERGYNDDIEQGNDDSSIRTNTEATAKVDLHRTLSTKTNASAKTSESLKPPKSPKSVMSILAIGTAIGTLQIHDANIPPPGTHPECMMQGDVVLIADLPKGMTIGCDLTILKFEDKQPCPGIREIPPGVHFVWGGPDPGFHKRNGFWIISAKLATGVPGECHAFWYNRQGGYLDEHVVQAEKRIQKMEVGKIYETLVPYDITQTEVRLEVEETGEVLALQETKGPQLWIGLTFAITGALLTRLTHREWNLWRVTPFCDAAPGEIGAYSDAQRENANGNAGCVANMGFAFDRGLETVEGFLWYQRNEKAVDTSVYVRQLVLEKCNHQNAEELIGEMQFAHISAVYVGNLHCMEQFKFIIKVMFRAYAWSVEEPRVFAKFLGAFNAILIHLDTKNDDMVFYPDGIFRDELRTILPLFKSRLCDQLAGRSADKDKLELLKTFETLEAWLLNTWEWDLRGRGVRMGKQTVDENGEVVKARLEEYGGDNENNMKTRIRRWSRRMSSRVLEPFSSFKNKSSSPVKKQGDQ